MVSFTARRNEAMLLRPARPTPCETKALSDLDDQRTLRYYETVVGFFRCCGGMRRPDDPAKAIKAALAEALVYYYPVAGRLREATDDKGRLVVECTEEGVVFVEADADVRLEDLGQPLLPPYPCVEELLCDAGETRSVVGKPLLFVQVTRLKCGGFVLGLNFCHSIADGFGMAQLISAIADLTRGEAVPTFLPVWRRELLTASLSSPSTVRMNTSTIPMYGLLLNTLGHRRSVSAATDDTMLSTPPDRMIAKYFLFGQRELSSLRGQLPEHLASSTTAFELLTAIMWRCRTVALGYEPAQQVRLMITMNARGRWNSHTPIPQGYYGNAHVSPIVEATVEELVGRPLADTLKLVLGATRGMTKERVRSLVEAVARLREWPPSAMERVYEVSDIRWTATNVLKFGWAELAGGGIPLAGDMLSKLGSDHTWCRNSNGEVSTVVSMLLPRLAMERFGKEIAVWLNKDDDQSLNILSSL